jgi:hypothetical protein
MDLVVFCDVQTFAGVDTDAVLVPDRRSQRYDNHTQVVKCVSSNDQKPSVRDHDHEY